MNEELKKYVDQAKEALTKAAQVAEEVQESFDLDMGDAGVSYTPVELAYNECGLETELTSLEDFKNMDTQYEYGVSYGWNIDPWLPSSAFC